MKIIIFLILIVSTSVASVALYAGIDHNPMDIFCINSVTCSFDYGYAAYIWFSWFIPVFIIPLIIIFTYRFLKTFLTRNSN